MRSRPLSLDKTVRSFVENTISSCGQLPVGTELRVADQELDRLRRSLTKLGGFPNAERMIRALGVSINAGLERRGSGLSIEWKPGALIIRREAHS